ncbi:MAG: insulinase family protein [Candidatus Eisenbacteria bacterium]|uniref:Insulinase family protein n=1 Tax=Eiseniibacteriota bacterium TaxID=2212470 RepID=A0A933SCF8_UNCEI|nr:insulinase family protein [Candidatus Eisenbacteria bacterium]
MKLRGSAVLTAAWLVLCVASGAPRACAASAAPAPTSVTLKNGLRVVLAPDSAAMAVDVAVWYPAGTRAERAGLAGASHLAERLMFRGSTGVPDGEHVRRVLAEGGSVNTQMSPDYACFWQTVPAEALPLALRLEAARMGGLSYGPDAFAAERRAARADLRGWRDRPVVTLALAQLRATLFEGHPYGRLLYGTDADLARMTAKDVEAWRRGAYAPGSAVLTIVGRFDAEAALALVRRTFEPLPKGSPATLPALKELAPGERRNWAREQTPARLLLAGWRVPPASDPDAPALELLAQVLGGGEASRLNGALVHDWHAALLTQAGVVPNREASMFWAMAALGADADSSTAERALLDQVGRLAREPVPGDELERARAQLLTGELFRQQTVRARAQAIGEAQVFAGDPANAERRLAQLASLTPADLQRVAQRVLVETARAIVWLAPREEAGR